MSTRSKATGLLLLLVSGASLALLIPGPPEPKYNGHTLSFWADQFWSEPLNSDGENQAGDALRAIGTNAFPLLHTWATYKDPAWSRTLERLLSNDTAQPVFRVFGIQSRELRANAAAYAFSAFQTNAGTVIPELTQLLKSNDRAVDALAHLGNQGLPTLLTTWANSTNPSQRWQIQLAVLENLTPDTRNTNLVPLLLDTMNRSAQSLSVNASNALFRIAPDFLTNSPAK